MKKVVFIVCGVLILMCAGLAAFYVWGLGAKSSDATEVTFVIEPGTAKTTVARDLANAGLIRNEYVLDVYMYLTRPNIQAGEYTLSANMTPKEMLNKFSNGDIVIHTVDVTLVEGKTLREYANTLAENLNFTANEFIEALSDTTYLNELIQTYWFLTSDILDAAIYYPMEGYLYPDTYEFLENASIDDVVKTILNHTESKLEPLKASIESSNYSIHQIMTMASIVEKEANSSEDRKMAAQVFYSRLNANMSLGSDVTSYYGVNKDMSEELTLNDLYDVNPYNTRLTDGSMNGKLPIGPIASPSLTAIEAAISPAETNYMYFVANVCTGEVFFQEDYNEFLAKAEELRTVCSLN